MLLELEIIFNNLKYYVILLDRFNGDWYLTEPRMGLDAVISLLRFSF